MIAKRIGAARYRSREGYPPRRMQLRAPTLDDARDVLDLIVARDIADLGRPDYTLEDVQNDWASPLLDLRRDAWLAVDDAGLPLGYALLDDRGAALVTVPPASEGRGVGTALRVAAESRAIERGEALCRQFVPAGNELARAHLLDAGYWPAYSYFRLAMELADVAPAPADVVVRQFSRGIDDAPVHALIDEAFAAIPGNMAQSLESWQAAKIEKQGWDPSLWLLHEDASGVAGIVLGERWEEGTGYVDFLAVAPRARRQGLGRAMLLHGLNALKDAGLVRAELSVQGENESAIALYESVGMRPISTTERWEKPLRAM
jgi:mycothiol synthase